MLLVNGFLTFMGLLAFSRKEESQSAA
jgi:hypothetical protein